MAYINGKHIPFIFQQIKEGGTGGAGWQYANGVYANRTEGAFNTGVIETGFKPDIVLFHLYDAPDPLDTDFSTVMSYVGKFGASTLCDGTIEEGAASSRWQKCYIFDNGFRVNTGSETPLAMDGYYYWYAIKIGEVE